jgi:catalase
VKPAPKVAPPWEWLIANKLAGIARQVVALWQAIKLFSYLDTQLSRLVGSPNFHQIPVNAPQRPFAKHQRDGHMQMAQPAGCGLVSYEPNTLEEDSQREQPETGFYSAAVGEPGAKGRIRAKSFADHYS